MIFKCPWCGRYHPFYDSTAIECLCRADATKVNYTPHTPDLNYNDIIKTQNELKVLKHHHDSEGNDDSETHWDIICKNINKTKKKDRITRISNFFCLQPWYIGEYFGYLPKYGSARGNPRDREGLLGSLHNRAINTKRDR